MRLKQHVGKQQALIFLVIFTVYKRDANGILRLIVQVRFDSENKSSYFKNHKRLFVPTYVIFFWRRVVFLQSSSYPFTFSVRKDTIRFGFF